MRVTVGRFLLCLGHLCCRLPSCLFFLFLLLIKSNVRRQLRRRPPEQLAHKRQHRPLEAHVSAPLLHQHRTDWRRRPRRAGLQRSGWAASQGLVKHLELQVGAAVDNAEQLGAVARDEKDAAGPHPIFSCPCSRAMLLLLSEAQVAEAGAASVAGLGGSQGFVEAQAERCSAMRTGQPVGHHGERLVDDKLLHGHVVAAHVSECCGQERRQRLAATRRQLAVLVGGAQACR